jgi:hypothetical protein
MIVAIEEYGMQKGKCIEKCCRAEKVVKNPGADTPVPLQQEENYNV